MSGRRPARHDPWIFLVFFSYFEQDSHFVPFRCVFDPDCCVLAAYGTWRVVDDVLVRTCIPLRLECFCKYPYARRTCSPGNVFRCSSIDSDGQRYSVPRSTFWQCSPSSMVRSSNLGSWSVVRTQPKWHLCTHSEGRRTDGARTKGHVTTKTYGTIATLVFGHRGAEGTRPAICPPSLGPIILNVGRNM